MSKLIAKNNIEHDGKTIPVGTVMDRFPGSADQVERLRAVGALADYEQPREVSYTPKGKESVLNEGPQGGEDASDSSGEEES